MTNDKNMLKPIYSLFLLLLLIFTLASEANDRRLVIYHDADYSVNKSSAEAMRMGMLTALDEVNSSIHGYQIDLVTKDHRGNIRRSQRNMEQFLKDPNGIFVLGGLHSPPYIKNRAFINMKEVPLLVPWAAGGPITRYADGINWVFRLSVDDTVAGNRISQFAIDQRKCQHPHLILENTPWGKSNQNTMSAYLNGKVPFGLSWFGWNTKQNTARMMLRSALSEQADCILLVANYTESTQFLQAMLSLPAQQRVPIISHWGLTGGDTNKLMTQDVKEGVNLNFIQSCSSFTHATDEFTKGVITRARKLFPEAFNKPELLPSPAGFIHAYDLGKLAITAMQQISLSGDMRKDRTAFRDALENLQKPVQGLIKNYQQPFTSWSAENPDAHEALKLENFCMAQFGELNQIEVLSN